ncbi:MAG TPA: hypothetical protein V6D28_30320 [Leptolyngbyaceae cyanobacterium]
MLKVITDFVFSQRDKIENDPIPFLVIFIIGVALGWFINSWIQKNRIETNEERIKLKDEKIQEMGAKIQSLEQKLASQQELKQNYNTFSLNENEIKALKAISRFEKENPFEASKAPAEYSIDYLVKDLQIDWGKANEILKKLRRLGLVESIWDNVSKFQNLARPINETPPGRLSKTGQEFLSNYRRGD